MLMLDMARFLDRLTRAGIYCPEKNRVKSEEITVSKIILKSVSGRVYVHSLDFNSMSLKLVPVGT